LTLTTLNPKGQLKIAYFSSFRHAGAIVAFCGWVWDKYLSPKAAQRTLNLTRSWLCTKLPRTTRTWTMGVVDKTFGQIFSRIYVCIAQRPDINLQVLCTSVQRSRWCKRALFCFEAGLTLRSLFGITVLQVGIACCRRSIYRV
jgi:hypothetical protein